MYLNSLISLFDLDILELNLNFFILFSIVFVPLFVKKYCKNLRESAYVVHKAHIHYTFLRY